MNPYLPAFIDEVRGILGEDYWPYGIEANAATLETFVRYAHEQGLTPDVLAVEDLFGETVRG
jgi:4,5-dihydroxyphthalate decarboxylase